MHGDVVRRGNRLYVKNQEPVCRREHHSGKNFFDLMDFISSSLLLPIGSLFISLFVGWVVWGKAQEEIAAHNGIIPIWVGAWGGIVKFIAPIAIAFILLK